MPSDDKIYQSLIPICWPAEKREIAVEGTPEAEAADRRAEESIAAGRFSSLSDLSDSIPGLPVFDRELVLRFFGQTGPVLREGEPCKHPGCLVHLSHPCEGCGRIGGRMPEEK